MRKKKILLLEIGNSHTEVLYCFVELLKQKNCEFYLVCNQELWSQMPNQKEFQDVLLFPDKTNFVIQILWFLKIRRFILSHKINSTIIGTTEITIVRNLTFFLPKNCVYTGIIHNAKKLEKGSTIKNIIFKKVKQFLLLSNYLKSNIQPLAQYKVDVFLPIHFPALILNNFIQKKDDDFYIVVPGKVDSERRDYIIFLQKINEQPFNSNIKFIFLGKFDKTTEMLVYKQLQQMNDWKKNIILFDYFVDYNLFQQYILLAHIILPLIKIDHDNFFDKFRISGSFNIALGNNKPMLLPQKYSANFDLQNNTLYYKNYDELMNLIFNCKNEIGILQQRIDAINFVEKRREEAERIFNFI